jgi:hypothetical protein
MPFNDVCLIPCLVTHFSKCALSNCCVVRSLLAHGDIETADSNLGLSINQNNPFNEWVTGYIVI